MREELGRRPRTCPLCNTPSNAYASQSQCRRRWRHPCTCCLRQSLPSLGQLRGARCWCKRGSRPRYTGRTNGLTRGCRSPCRSSLLEQRRVPCRTTPYCRTSLGGKPATAGRSNVTTLPGAASSQESLSRQAKLAKQSQGGRRKCPGNTHVLRLNVSYCDVVGVKAHA